MRRNTPSFTVEVRRQPRRSSNSSANGRLFETAPVRSAFDRDTQRAADAVFESKEPDRPLADAAPAPPKGRILPSLVVDDAATRSLRGDSVDEPEETPRATKRRSTRLQTPAKLPKPRRQSASPTAETAPSTDVLSPSEPVAASSKGIGARALRRQPKKRAKKLKNDRLAAWLNEPEPAIIAESPPRTPSAVAEVSPTVRKRTIIGRYVVGDELKPGERWKRLLRKTR